MPHEGHHPRRRYGVVVLWIAAVCVLLVVVHGCVSTPRGSSEAPTRPAPMDEPSDGPAATGVPTPNRRSASASGVEYAAGPQRWLYLTDDEVDAAVRDIAAPRSADGLAAAVVEDVREAREGLSASSGPIWWIVRPLAVRVEDLTNDRATVEVWVVTVLSAREVAVPQAEWRTVDLDLVWIEDTWKVDAIRDTPGPTPMVGPGDRPWDAVPFDEALEGFQRLDGETVR